MSDTGDSGTGEKGPKKPRTYIAGVKPKEGEEAPDLWELVQERVQFYSDYLFRGQVPEEERLLKAGLANEADESRERRRKAFVRCLPEREIYEECMKSSFFLPVCLEEGRALQHCFAKAKKDLYEKAAREHPLNWDMEELKRQQQEQKETQETKD
eukprot:Clim_evm45s214 gene=Clim_evmTU45s214